MTHQTSKSSHLPGNLSQQKTLHQVLAPQQNTTTSGPFLPASYKSAFDHRSTITQHNTYQFTLSSNIVIKLVRQWKIGTC